MNDLYSICIVCGQPIKSIWQLVETDSGAAHKACLLQQRVDKLECGMKRAVEINERALPSLLSGIIETMEGYED